MTKEGAVPVRASLRGLDIQVQGVVQGVGFRPFVHRLAASHRLGGWVRNEAGSVHIRVEGTEVDLNAFVECLPENAPPLAQIEHIQVRRRPAKGRSTEFRVLRSDVDSPGRLPVSPDVAICEACEAELSDLSDRRYRYPFITCTDCGPRFTVIEDMPYDRERSTMRAFRQCGRCVAEYSDPGDRRYHSQTNSCPDCGPHTWLEDGEGATRAEGHDAIIRSAEALKEGRILAVRGLGGFHLAVDGTNSAAVERLRSRKTREAKPLAIMVRTLEQARVIGQVGPLEEALLRSRERPIVLLRNIAHNGLSEAVAPGLDTVGVMLAYTPMHLLLLEAVARPLVMTSGNRSDEPIATSNEEARHTLADVADDFLLHDREIVSRYDDSLVRVIAGQPTFIRRARGYAPLPIGLPVGTPLPMLAVGPHLKNTFTLAVDRTAYVSQHIGDLETYETLQHFRCASDRYRALFRVDPEVLVRDLHPGYMSTDEAERMALPLTIAVQHHHAHIAAVLGEHGLGGHGLRRPVLGIAFDGTGYGDDGLTWGAEFLVTSLSSYRRVAHLRYAPLPGGDLAARSPWRAALGYLSLDPARAGAFGRAFQDVPAPVLQVVERQVGQGLNSPLASSMGRLFDAASAVLGVRSESSFEGQAPMELEALAGTQPADPLPFPAIHEKGRVTLDPIPLLAALGEARARGEDPGLLAARFHESIAQASAELAVILCEKEGLDQVALSGGCFQNARLLASLTRRLRARGLHVLLHQRLGPNDGAVSYGQAVVAAARLAEQYAPTSDGFIGSPLVPMERS